MCQKTPFWGVVRIALLLCDLLEREATERPPGLDLRPFQVVALALS